jgi:hypothetical protein
MKQYRFGPMDDDPKNNIGILLNFNWFYWFLLSGVNLFWNLKVSRLHEIWKFWHTIQGNSPVQGILPIV